MLSRYLLKGCGLLYGLFSYAVFLILAVKEGSIFRRTSEKAKKELSTGIFRLSSLMRPVLISVPSSTQVLGPHRNPVWP